MKKRVKVVWQVCGSSGCEFSSYSEGDAISHARSLNAGPVPAYQVERGLVINGRTV
jgi:hypothetical protein